MTALSYVFRIVLLLVIANGAPILANRLLGNRFAWPVDNGIKLGDGRRLFGNSKTWRGLISSVCFTAVAATFLCGMELLTGALFGALAMAGDLSASFIKRRLGNAESSQLRGLDTVPESLLPIMLLKEPLALNISDTLLVVLLFFLIEELVSPVLYLLHIRKRPY